MIALAGQLHRGFGLRQTQRFAAIELAEVDGLGDVSVGLGPVLRNFEDQPGHVFHLALAHHVGDAEQQRGALFDGSAAPALVGAQCGLHGGLDLFFSGFLMQANDLGRLCGIDGLDLVAGFHALAADDQVILAAKLSADFVERGAHLAHVVIFGEIKKWFVLERPIMQADLGTGGGFNGCHKCS